MEDESTLLNVLPMDAIAQGSEGVAGPSKCTPVPIAECGPNMIHVHRQTGTGTGSTATTGQSRALSGCIKRRGRDAGRGRVRGADAEGREEGGEVVGGADLPRIVNKFVT